MNIKLGKTRVTLLHAQVRGDNNPFTSYDSGEYTVDPAAGSSEGGRFNSIRVKEYWYKSHHVAVIVKKEAKGKK